MPVPPNLRMLAPTRAALQSRKVNGRTYSGTAGQILTVPSQDGTVLNANGWILICPSGPTSSRPTGRLGIVSNGHGTQMWDETLNQMIVSDGTNWRDPLTGNIV